MAFCSACGAQQTDDAVFCSSCGKAVAGSPVSTENPEGFATGSTPPTPGKDPLAFIKRLPKAALIAIPAVLILAIVGAVVGIKALNAPTKANAASFIATEKDLPFDVKQAEEPTDYTAEDFFSDKCSSGQDLATYLHEGDLWAISELEKASAGQNYFSLDQQIISMPSETMAKRAIEAAAAVATDNTCQLSEYATTMSFKFDYQNPQNVSEAFGVGAEGIVIESSSWVYMKLSEYADATESSSRGYYAFVRRGNLLMLVYLSSTDADGTTTNMVLRKDLVEAVAPFISKFAG